MVMAVVVVVVILLSVVCSYDYAKPLPEALDPYCEFHVLDNVV